MRLSIVLVLSLVTLTSAAFAQITSATITGTIKDETGGLLPGVDVTITNTQTGLTRSAVTDGNGYFTMPGLTPGIARATIRDSRPRCKRHRAEVAQRAALGPSAEVVRPRETIGVG
jgi:hypothetical protein